MAVKAEGEESVPAGPPPTITKLNVLLATSNGLEVMVRPWVSGRRVERARMAEGSSMVLVYCSVLGLGNQVEDEGVGVCDAVFMHS